MHENVCVVTISVAEPPIIHRYNAFRTSTQFVTSKLASEWLKTMAYDVKSPGKWRWGKEEIECKCISIPYTN
jgi:hypothetical protein